MPRASRSHYGRRTRGAQCQNVYLASQSDEGRMMRLENQRLRIARARSIMAQEGRIVPNRTRTSTANARRNLQGRQNPRPLHYELLAFNYDPTIEYSADVSVNFGTMSIVCAHCRALKFKNEPAGLCCATGKVKLPPFNQLPQPLASLLSGENDRSKHFLNHIQHYNSSFQMTSFGANIIEPRGFNPTFKV